MALSIRLSSNCQLKNVSLYFPSLFPHLHPPAPSLLLRDHFPNQISPCKLFVSHLLFWETQTKTGLCMYISKIIQVRNLIPLGFDICGLKLARDLIFGLYCLTEKLRLEGLYLNLGTICCILFFS